MNFPTFNRKAAASLNFSVSHAVRPNRLRNSQQTATRGRTDCKCNRGFICPNSVRWVHILVLVEIVVEIVERLVT